jgi:hypothetical protein
LFPDDPTESLSILVDEEDVHAGRTGCLQHILLDQRHHHDQHGGHDEEHEQTGPVTIEQAQFLEKGG